MPKQLVLRVDAEAYTTLKEFLLRYYRSSFYPESMAAMVYDLLASAVEIPDIFPGIVPEDELGAETPPDSEAYEDWHQMGLN